MPFDHEQPDPTEGLTPNEAAARAVIMFAFSIGNTGVLSYEQTATLSERFRRANNLGDFNTPEQLKDSNALSSWKTAIPNATLLEGALRRLGCPEELAGVLAKEIHEIGEMMRPEFSKDEH
jgi:hypothetical protein